MTKRKKWLLLALGALVLLFCGCRKEETNEIASLEQLNAPGYTVAASSGKSAYTDVEAGLPEAELLSIGGLSEGVVAVQKGIIHGYADSETTIEIAMSTGALQNVRMLEGYLGQETDIVAGISRKANYPNLLQEINAFLASIKADGTMADIYRRWVTEGKYEIPDIPKPEHPSRKLVVGTTGLTTPFSFYQEGELTGMDLEIIYRLANYLNAELEVRIYDFYGIMTALEAGMCDCVFSNLNATPERREAMLFSDPVYTTRTRVLVYYNQDVVRESFVQQVKTSFEKTFFRESRWKLILNGIGVTVKISLLTAFFGTALGFGLCLLRRLNRKWVNFLIMTYVRILQGTPIVVLLMILFYVVFAKSNFSGQVVAVIAFSMNFAAYVSEIMRAGIESIDRGQTEAALALGYTKMQAFFRIVMPQAAMQFLPVYKGEFISLVKTTSIVGYIAVQDLTKASDIIRSRTYEAFFPLIATAIIYFLISNLLTAALSAVELKIRPNRNKRSVKGVIEKGANHAQQ